MFSLAPYLLYRGRKPLDFSPAVQHSNLRLYFTGHLRHWFASENFLNHGIQDSEVWVKQRVWCNISDVTCLNVDFLAYFGRNSGPLSYDIKIKRCRLIMTLYLSQDWKLFQQSLFVSFYGNHFVHELRIAVLSASFKALSWPIVAFWSFALGCENSKIRLWLYKNSFVY